MLLLNKKDVLYCCFLNYFSRKGLNLNNAIKMGHYYNFLPRALNTIGPDLHTHTPVTLFLFIFMSILFPFWIFFGQSYHCSTKHTVQAPPKLNTLKIILLYNNMPFLLQGHAPSSDANELVHLLVHLLTLKSY